MATHGCPPEQHRVQLQDGVMVTEECALCGYRITYGPVGHDRAYPPARPPLAGPRRNGGLIAAVLVAALVAGGIGGGIGFWAANRNDTNSTTVSASGDPEALNRKPTSVSGIA
ncbi:hypothetical protein ACH4RB_42150, partial [Streptomyces rimosus]